jgi:hypothetical protein
MSHALGAIQFPDGHIRYCETGDDYVISHHYETIEEVNANWRQHYPLSCDCGNEEEVDIYSDYGSGFYMEGKACLTCGSVEVIRDEGYVHFSKAADMNEVNHWAKNLIPRDWS